MVSVGKPVYRVGSISFKMMDPELVRRSAVVTVVNPELYDMDGYPIEGGLMDPRMGVIDPGIRCRTCGGKVKECTGHFGVIELARPVIHYEFAELVYNFLRGTCKGCGRLMVGDEVREKFLKRLRLVEKSLGELKKWEFVKKIVAKLRKVEVCPHCGVKKGDITFSKPTSFFEDKVFLTPIDVEEWLRKVRVEDYELLGLNPEAGRIEWAVINIVQVPPVTVRPSITLEGGQRSEDDLTHKLSDIVRTNQRLFENLNAGAPAPIIEDLWLLLQYHVTTFFDNDVTQIPPARHRSGRPLKTLATRLKGKDGRFRRNLAGKRVNFSSRTVISPDPLLSVDEVGVPFEVARVLTVPERVTEWNIDFLRGLIVNGDSVYPGANYVITSDGKMKRVTDQTKEVILEELEPGFVVERHLLDGDFVLFNRHPSLHKMSIMGHRVRVLPGKTFRLNVATTVPYNADFDGDEMNIHVPQTEEARAEAALLTNVNSMILSPRNGEAIIGVIEDSVSGCYLLSKEVELPRDVAIKLLFSCGVEDFEVKSVYSGLDLFNALIPKGLSFKGSRVVVEDGRVVSGVLDKSVIGVGGELIKAVFHAFGESVAGEFVSRVSLLGINYLRLRGFSMKLSDIHVPKSVKDRVGELVSEGLREVGGLIDKFEKRELEPFAGRSVRETLELRIVSTLNKVRNRAVKIVGDAISGDDNDAMVMVKTRARGSLLNIGLMNAFNGQTSLRGSRISKGYSGRVFPHFVRGDLGAVSHGFIKHGFIDGLDPFEFFFVAMTGRASLMDKSLATPKSGYLQRRLVNALQDLRVFSDLSVRDDSGNIVQFVFGDDGLDVSKSSFKSFSEGGGFK